MNQLPHLYSVQNLSKNTTYKKKQSYKKYSIHLNKKSHSLY